MIDADGLRHQAEDIAAGRLRKARGLLAAVGPDERLAIETTAYAVALGVVDCLLREAQTDNLLRLALSDTQEARRLPRLADITMRASHAHPARGRRKVREGPGDPQKTTAGKPCSPW
jgi:hypothetical protein